MLCIIILIFCEQKLENFQVKEVCDSKIITHAMNIQDISCAST